MYKYLKLNCSSDNFLIIEVYFKISSQISKYYRQENNVYINSTTMTVAVKRNHLFTLSKLLHDSPQEPCDSDKFEINFFVDVVFIESNYQLTFRFFILSLPIASQSVATRPESFSKSQLTCFVYIH